MRRRTSLMVCACLWFWACRAPAEAPGPDAGAERAKIEFLLQAVAESKVTFVRNGTSYDGAKAAAHLREKWEAAGEAVKTARQFIELCATRSALSGQAYEIILADQKSRVPSAAWLETVLFAHELTAAAPARDAPGAEPGQVAAGPAPLPPHSLQLPAQGSASVEHSRDYSLRQVRRRALEAFSKDERMTAVLMVPWHPSSVKTIGDALLGPFLPSNQAKSLVDLVAILARREQDAPEGAEARRQLDALYRRAMSGPGDGKNRDSLWCFVLEAIENLCAPELLTDPFWEGLRAEMPGFGTVELVADQNILRRLEDMEKRGAFPPGSPCRGFFIETLTIVKASLICPAIRNEPHHGDRLRMAEDVLFRLKMKAEKR